MTPASGETGGRILVTSSPNCGPGMAENEEFLSNRMLFSTGDSNVWRSKQRPPNVFTAQGSPMVTTSGQEFMGMLPSFTSFGNGLLEATPILPWAIPLPSVLSLTSSLQDNACEATAELELNEQPAAGR